MKKLFCKENVNKEVIISTEEFNSLLKENKIKWSVKSDCEENGMSMLNYSNIDETFYHLILRKYNVKIKEMMFAEDDKNKIRLLYEYK